MLLRRISHHYKSQNWVAISIDFLVVVLGMFVSLQLTEWKNAKKELEIENYYLVQLEKDFKRSVEANEHQLLLLDRYLKVHKIAIESLSAKSLKKKNIQDFEKSLQALSYFHSSMTFWQNYEEMQSSGRLQLLTSQELKLALQEAKNSQDAFYKNYNVVIQNSSSFINYIYSKVGVYLYSDLEHPLVNYDFNDLAKDPRVLVSMQNLATLNMTNQYLLKTLNTELKKTRDTLAKYNKN